MQLILAAYFFSIYFVSGIFSTLDSFLSRKQDTNRKIQMAFDELI